MRSSFSLATMYDLVCVVPPIDSVHAHVGDKFATDGRMGRLVTTEMPVDIPLCPFPFPTSVLDWDDSNNQLQTDCSWLLPTPRTPEETDGSSLDRLWLNPCTSWDMMTDGAAANGLGAITDDNGAAASNNGGATADGVGAPADAFGKLRRATDDLIAESNRLTKEATAALIELRRASKEDADRRHAELMRAVALQRSSLLSVARRGNADLLRAQKEWQKEQRRTDSRRHAAVTRLLKEIDADDVRTRLQRQQAAQRHATSREATMV